MKEASKTAVPEASLSLSGIQAQIGFLEGDVLTVIDAAYHNPTQNKAVKDLVKQKFRSQRDHITALAQGETGCSTIMYRGELRIRKGNHILIPIDDVVMLEESVLITSDGKKLPNQR